MKRERMTNTIYYYSAVREYYDSSSASSSFSEQAPRHDGAAAEVKVVEAASSLIPLEQQQDDDNSTTSTQTFSQTIRGLNPEAENNDGKDLACDSSENFSSNSITSTPRSEGGKLEYSISKSFSFKELRSATRKFHRDGVLGHGSFGMVFKGWIDENKLTATKPGKGIAVAIKRLSQHSRQGHGEWWAEVKYLGMLYHPNLVRLFGYCLDNEQHLLVYEFMPRGSLDNHLYWGDPSPLSWSVRMKIALGTAKGLAFLHSAAINVIHRGVTSSNILLDSDYNAKLSDFGFATDGPTDMSYVSTSVVGAHKFMAPEYVSTGHLTAKSDVYSFGAVLIEILLGGGANDLRHYMCPGVKPFVYSKREIFLLPSSHLEGQCSLGNAQKAANLVLQCLAEKAQFRPNMDEVVTTLEQLC